MGLKRAKYLNQYDFSGGVNLEKPAHLIEPNECFASRTDYDETLNCYWDAGIKKRLGTNRINASDKIDRGNCESTTPPMFTGETAPHLYVSGDYVEVFNDGDCEASTPPELDDTPNGYSVITAMLDNGDCESTSAPIVTGEITREANSNATFERSTERIYNGSYSWKVKKTSSAGGGDAVAYLSGTDPPSATYGSEYTFNEGYTLDIHTSVLDSTHFVVVYEDAANSNYGTAIAGIITNGNEVSYGSEYVFCAENVAGVSSVKLDSTHIAIVFADASGVGNAIIGIINGNEISFGTKVSFAPSNVSNVDIARIDDTHFVIAFTGTSNDGKAIIGLTDGDNTISSFGSSNTFDASTIGGSSVVMLDSTHFVIAYNSPGGKTDAIIGVTDGETTISSYGSANEFSAVSTSNPEVDKLDSTHFIIAFSLSSGSDAKVIIGLTDGATTISSYGSASTFQSSSGGSVSITVMSPTSFVVAYTLASNAATTIVGVTDGATAISSYGAASTYEAALGINNAIDKIDSTNFVVACYEVISAVLYGRAYVGDITYSDNATDDMHGFSTNTDYFISLQARMDLATAANASFILSEYYSSAWNDTELACTTAANMGFENLYTKITTNASTTGVKLFVKIASAEVAGKVLYIDEVEIFEGTNVSNGYYNRVSEKKAAGTYSWRLIKGTINGGGDCIAQLQDSVATDDMHGLTVSKTYEIIASVYANVYTAANAKIIFSEYHSGGWNDTTMACTTSGAWESLHSYITLNASTTGIKMFLEIDNVEGINRRLHVDSLSLRQISKTTQGEWARSTDQIYAGSYSYKLKKLSVAAGGNTIAYLTDNINTNDKHGLLANTEYTFEASMYSDAATPANVKLIFSEYYSGGWNDTVTFALTAADTWEKKTSTITTNASAAAFKWYTEIPSAEAKFKVLYVDKLVIFVPPQYVLLDGIRHYRSIAPFATTIVAGDDESSETYIKYLDGSDEFQDITGGSSISDDVDIDMASWKDNVYVSSGDAVLQKITSDGSTWSRADIVGLTSKPQYVTLHKDRLWVAGGTVTAGFQEYWLTDLTAGGATGLSTTTQYYFKINIDGGGIVEYDITTAGDVTYAAVLTLMDTATDTAAKGYQEWGLTGKAGGTATGLSTTTKYYFTVAVDGATAVKYDITTAADVTFAAVLSLMNTAVSGCSYSLTGGDVRLTSDTQSTSSAILQTAGQTPDLAGTFTDFSAYDSAVAGKGNVAFSLVSGDVRCTSDTTGEDSSVSLSAGTTGTDLAGTLTGFTAYNTAVVGGAMAAGYLECSALDNDTSWSAGNGEAFNIGFKDGDPITALKSFKADLICYKMDSIWVMKGDNLNNWFQQKQEGAIGCVAHLSIADVGFGHIFLGPDNVYFFNGVELHSIGNKIKPWLDAIPTAQRSKATACYYDNYYRLSFAKSGSSYNDFEVILDLKNFRQGKLAWWPNGGRNISAYVPYNGPNDANTLYTCDSDDGYLRQIETGTQDDDVNYDMEFHTKYFVFDAPNNEKIYDRIKLDSKPGIGDFTIDIISGLDDDVTETFSVTSESSGNRETTELALPSTLDGMAISYKITHSENYEAEFYGFSIAYKYLSF